MIMPQIQFIHRRLFFQLWRRDKYPQCMLYSSRCNSWTRFLTCPVCCFDKCLVRWCRKLWSFCSCSSSLFVDIPFVPQMLIPTVHTILQIIEIPHLLFVFGCRCPCCAGRANSQVLPWRRRSCSHSFSSLRNRRPLFPTTCALWFRLQKTAESPQLQFMIVVDIPFVPQTQILMVQTIQQTTEFPQLQYFLGGRCSCWQLCIFFVAVCVKTVEIPQLRLVRGFADMGYDCAFTLRGSGARVSVCGYADMGYDCAFALRGSGARVSVCGFGDVGKDCALALPGLVLLFIPVVAQRQLPWSAYSADHRDCPVSAH